LNEKWRQLALLAISACWRLLFNQKNMRRRHQKSTRRLEIKKKVSEGDSWVREVNANEGESVLIALLICIHVLTQETPNFILIKLITILYLFLV
jgi:hypothetical protein